MCAQKLPALYAMCIRFWPEEVGDQGVITSMS